MAFDPSVGDVIRLFGDEYTVQEHPGARGIVFAAEAGRATVYQVKDAQHRLWALKVFFPRFRTPHVLEASKHLRAVESYEGLMAASRRIVTPEEGDARTIRDLQYAVLMRWVPGRTWFDLLEMVGIGKVEPPIHTLPSARQLASRFLRVMEQLENSGVAHTDISAGNVTVEHRAKDTQLLDLEDMYLPKCPPPLVKTPGTDGYRHPNVKPPQNTWEAAGDRYATAVLSAELLLMSEEKLAKWATSNGYFAGHREDAPARDRFRFAEPYLREVAPGFSKLFVDAWTSDSLKSCPPIRQLYEAARKDWATVIVPTPVSEPDLLDEVLNSGFTDTRPDRGRVWFEKDERVTFDSNPTSEPTATPGNQQPPMHARVRFESVTPAISAPSAPPSSAPKKARSRVLRTLLWIGVAVALILLAYWRHSS